MAVGREERVVREDCLGKCTIKISSPNWKCAACQLPTANCLLPTDFTQHWVLSTVSSSRRAVVTAVGLMSMTSGVGEIIICWWVLRGANWVRSARRLR